jgi:hypothetical protein
VSIHVESKVASVVSNKNKTIIATRAKASNSILPAQQQQ